MSRQDIRDLMEAMPDKWFRIKEIALLTDTTIPNTHKHLKHLLKRLIIQKRTIRVKTRGSYAEWKAIQQP